MAWSALDDDRDVRVGGDMSCGGLQAERRSCRTTRLSATTLISGWLAIASSKAFLSAMSSAAALTDQM